MHSFIPPEPDPVFILALAILAAVAKGYWYRQTHNGFTLAEMLARVSIVLIYSLVAIANQQTGFEEIFTSDLWRIFARYGFMLLFLVEIVPWLAAVIRKTMARTKK